jgi:cytochrome P450
MVKIRNEVTPAFDPSSGSLADISYLVNNTPLLNSMYQETLRYTSGALGVRKVEEDTVIAGYRFLAGSLVMMPARPGHFDSEIFGNDMTEFVPDRFIREDDKRSGRRNPGTKVLRAFGGGNTLCPGRHFAANEVLAFVATMVYRFDLEPVVGQVMAKPDMKAPQVGTYVADREVKLCLRIRS